MFWLVFKDSDEMEEWAFDVASQVKGTPHMLVAQHVTAEGKALYEEVCREDGEGVVAKLAASPYALINGKSPWVKVLNPEYSQKEGRREFFDWARDRG